jgi:hypothetical protein
VGGCLCAGEEHGGLVHHLIDTLKPSDHFQTVLAKRCSAIQLPRKVTEKGNQGPGRSRFDNFSPELWELSCLVDDISQTKRRQPMSCVIVSVKLHQPLVDNIHRVLMNTGDLLPLDHRPKEAASDPTGNSLLAVHWRG